MVGLISSPKRPERKVTLAMTRGGTVPSHKDAVTAFQDPAVVASILAAAVDLTVLMTPDGVICDQVMAGPDLPLGLFTGWPGKQLSETVTVESKPKIEQMLGEAGVVSPPRWRQVNHPVSDGRDIPISYSAVKVGPQGHIIAIGRDMSKVAVLQQRLLSAEQAVEQEYQRLRNAETRFRVLLQSATDAIVIVDARTGRIVECNPAACSVLDRPMKKLQNAIIDDVFQNDDADAVKTALDGLRTVGKTDDIVLSPSDAQQQAVVSFSMFRQENATYFLLRMVPHSVGTSAVVLPRTQSKVVKIISEMPDGFVVTDTDLKILSANAAFLEFVQLASEEQARGVSLDRWLGRQGVDVNLIVSQLLDKGEIRNFQTILRGQFGAMEDVEVSAVAVTEGETPCFGFALHQTSRQNARVSKQDQGLLRSVDEFTRLVGKVPLKDLVRESTDIIERLCIEAALQMNGDNRAGAAEMLGLSRQSLYVKLHRYGIDMSDLHDQNN
jgi:transcriptional regulator PpsR